MSKTGQSRGNQKNKQFIQDSANSFVVESFRDVSASAPIGPVDGQGYIVEEAVSLDGSWGTITGLQEKDIIRWRASKGIWEIVHSAVASNEGAESYVKEDDVLYVFDGADWNIASGSGGGVKNFAQKQSTSYKITDWTSGNSASFGASGSPSSVLSIEDVNPLEGKKSFKVTTGVATENDWFYLTVDIDKYARGGAIAYTMDYTWDGEEDINLHVTDPALTDPNLHGNELNVLKNTENDFKLSRPSRVVYAHPDDETQVLVGFQFPAGITAGKELIFDLVKVTDDIGVIGTGSGRLEQSTNHRIAGNTLLNRGTSNFVEVILSNLTVIGDGLITARNTGNLRTEYVANQDCTVDVSFGADMVAAIGNSFIYRSRENGVIANGSTSYSATAYATVSASFDLKAGEYFWHQLGSVDINNNGVPYTVNIQATAEEEGLRFLSVPNGEKLKDTFAARIANNGTATIKSQSIPFIQSVLRDSEGFVTVTFVSGFFSVPPAITATTENVGTDRKVEIHLEQTTTSVQFRTSSAATNPAKDSNFDFTATRQGADIAPDIIGVPVSIQGQTHEADSYFNIYDIETGGALTGTGTEASNKIVVFKNITDSLGSAITYEKDLVQGDRFVINETGLYDMTLRLSCTVASQEYGVMKNISNRTLTISAHVIAEPAKTLVFGFGSASGTDSGSNRVYLVKGDVVTCHTNASSLAISNHNAFTISKVGTQPLLDGGLVERPGSTLFLHTSGNGAAGRGSVNSHIRRYTAIGESTAVANGDVKYTDSATDGMSVEILEDGLYNMSATQASPIINENIGISLNSTQLTTSISNINNGNKVALNYVGAGEDGNASATRLLRKGDIIRAHTSTAANVTTRVLRCFFSITKLGQTVKYSSRVYKEDPIAYQTKTLSATLVADLADVTDLKFSNLEIGKTYRVRMQGQLTAGSTTGAAVFQAIHDGNIEAQIRHQGPSSTGSAQGTSSIFTATAETLVFLFSRSGGSTQTLVGDGTKGKTFATLEELPFHNITSKWT